MSKWWYQMYNFGFNPTCAKLAFTKKVTHKYCIYKFKTRVRLRLGKTHKNVSRPWKLEAKANCFETPKKQQFTLILL